MKPMLTFLVVLAAGLPHAAAAQSLQAELHLPSEIWKHETASASSSCILSGQQPNSTSSLSQKLRMSTGDEFSSLGNSSVFRLPQLPTGVHNINLTCSSVLSDGNATAYLESRTVRQISVRQLSMRLSSPPKNYAGSAVIFASLSIMPSGQTVPSFAGSGIWSVTENGETRLSQATFSQRTGNWTLLLHNNITAGNRSFAVAAGYNGSSAQDTVPVEIIEPFEARFAPKSQFAIPDTDIVYDVALFYRNLPVNRSQAEFTASVGGIKAESKLRLDRLYIKAPHLEAREEPYPVEISAEYQGRSRYYSGDMKYVRQLYAEVVSDGPVEGSIIFEGNNSRETYALENGKAYFHSSPGKANITFELGKESMLFEDVAMDRDIRLALQPIMAVEGLNLAAGHAAALSVPFGKASIKQTYDPHAYAGLDENMLAFYRCMEWSFSRSMCGGVWENSSGILNTVTQIAEAGIGNQQALVIADPAQIFLSASAGKERYRPGEMMELGGYVKDASGKEMEGVEIRANLEGENGLLDSGAAATDGNGAFFLNMNAPHDAGQFHIRLEAGKGLFLNGKAALEISVYEKKELSIKAPADISIKLGEKEIAEASLTNTGQASLSGITVRAAGLNGTTGIDPLSFERLEPGEERKIRIELSPASAGDFQMIISAQGEVSDTEGFIVRVEAPDQPVTGFLHSIPPDADKIMLGLIALFAMLVGKEVIRIRKGRGRQPAAQGLPFDLSAQIFSSRMRRRRRKRRGLKAGRAKS